MTCAKTSAITTIAGAPSSQRRTGIVASNKLIRSDLIRQANCRGSSHHPNEAVKSGKRQTDQLLCSNSFLSSPLFWPTSCRPFGIIFSSFFLLTI